MRGRVTSPAATAVDGFLGSVLTACVGIGIVWVLGALALANGGDARREVQRSTILQSINTVLPPSSGLLDALARLDPFPRIDGPEANVPAPHGRDRARRGRARRGGLGGEDPRQRVRAGRRGLGLGRGRRARRDQRARRRRAEGHAGARPRAASPGWTRWSCRSIPRTTWRCCGSRAWTRRRSTLASNPKSGTSAAILGFPGNGPYDVRAGRVGQTREVITQDAYGQGPVRRSITSLRGAVRSGNSGGPMVDKDGQVVTTVFAATTSGPRGGFGVPNAIAREALQRAQGSNGVSTGPCTG